MLRDLFRGKKATPITDEPPYVPPVEIEGVEMAIPVRRLAALFVENGWAVALDGKRPQEATPDAIRKILAGHLEGMAESPEVDYTAGFRFLALRDRDYPDGFDLFLYVGRANTTPAPATPEVAA